MELSSVWRQDVAPPELRTQRGRLSENCPERTQRGGFPPGYPFHCCWPQSHGQASSQSLRRLREREGASHHGQRFPGVLSKRMHSSAVSQVRTIGLKSEPFSPIHLRHRRS